MSSTKLMDHYLKHQNDFGVASAAEYEAMADSFLGGPRTPTVRECRRRSGAVVRFDAATGEFGVLTVAGYIMTYFKPNPVDHGLPTNLDYFMEACKQ